MLALPVKVWDESYGKQGVVTTPDGLVIGLNENTQDDLYGGYQVHEQTVPASMEVVAICRTDDIAQEAAFFAAFGFTAHSAAGLPGLALQADQGSGVLHLLRSDALSPRRTGPAGDQFGPPYVVDLWFQTSQPLDALTAQLRNAGYPATMIQNAKASTCR